MPAAPTSCASRASSSRTSRTKGIIESCAGELLRYRRAIGAERVLVFADIKKKHAAHAITADVSIAETAHAAELFLADGLIVTGTATGCGDVA